VSVVQTRADSLGLTVELGNVFAADFSNRDVAGVIFQYPDTEGSIYDFSEVVQRAHSNGVSYDTHIRKCSVYKGLLLVILM
jgi:glycine dehydrogenase